MNPRQHALLARTLIERCGGLEEAAKACRVGKSVLSQSQTAGSGCFMAADVIADLEAYCGEPIYSRALVENRPCASMSADVMREACDVVEASADLLREVRAAEADGSITELEDARIRRRIDAAEEQLRQARGALDRRSAA